MAEVHAQVSAGKSIEVEGASSSSVWSRFTDSLKRAIDDRECPWCDRDLPDTSDDLRTCPRCGRSLTDENGRPIRRIDVWYETCVERQRRTFWKIVLWGTPIALAITAAVPLLHLAILSPALIPFVVVVHMIVVRLFLIRNAYKVLSRRRKVFVRWLTRFSFLWLGVPGYGLTSIPIVGIVAGGSTFVALTSLTHAYTAWSLSRDRERLPLTWPEKAILTAAIVLTLVVFVFLIMLLAGLGLTVAKLQSLFGG